MWKWTDSQNIKAIILDGNSLDDEYLSFPYHQYIQNINVFIVQDAYRVRPLRYDYIEYYDIPTLLQEILEKAKCSSFSVISISHNPLFLKEMMQNHIGTVLIGELKKEFLKNTPDFTNVSLKSLPNILLNKRMGYGAEVFSTYNKARRTMSLLRCESKIELSNHTFKTVELYFGGRYYAKRHEYLLNDPLSFVVRGFKQQYIESVDLFFESAIQFIRKKENVDILTSIPLKPHDIDIQKFDRFSSLKLNHNSKDEIRLQKVLQCKKDFSQKGNDLFVRKESVIGAFEVIQDVKGKNIVIIDDVFSTGATMFEAIKTLYDAGANNVIGILLAVNQMTESSSLIYQNLTCPCCGSPMELRMNSKNGQIFFGCKEYQSHPEEKYTIDVAEGLDMLKKINQLTVTDVIDLEDEY